jgi:DNA replication initiation complex subunit (GINS family)
MVELNITYETLFDLLRRERNREELQPLDQDFFSQVLVYVEQKQLVLRSFTEQKGEFVTSESEKARIQFHNIKKILRELYDRREKKLCLLAVNSVKTRTTSLPQGILPQEQQLFEELLRVLKDTRSKVLDPLLSQVSSIPTTTQSTTSSPTTTSQSTPSTSTPTTPQPASPTPTLPQTPASTAQKTPGDQQDVSVRFLKPVPRFAGPQGAYGPFVAQDQATLPVAIAQVLLKKGRLEIIE